MRPSCTTTPTESIRLGIEHSVLLRLQIHLLNSIDADGLVIGAIVLLRWNAMHALEGLNVVVLILHHRLLHHLVVL